MTLTLIIVSAICLILGIFLFIKKKGILGWFFSLLSLVGFGIAITILYVFPDKL